MPYPKRYKNKAFQATGIAMDCSNSSDEKIQPSLEEFYKGMSNDIGHTVEFSKTLEYLSCQGVLMLNTDLTCKLNKTGSHYKLWECFQKYFLQEIMGKYKGIHYVLSGKSSHRMEKYIMNIGNYVYKIDHPVTASYSGISWDCKNVFTKINKILKEEDKKIFWDRKEWEEDCPF